jgi:esterase
MKLAHRETGEGQPVIILHGLFGQSDNWNTLAKRFAAENLRVFTVDLRNHGLSPHSSTWNYKGMAEDIMELISDHKLEKPVLIGHSMGGKVVMHYEKQFPGLAFKIVIVDIAAKEYPAHHNDVLDALHAVDFNIINTRKEAEAVMSEHISDFGTRQFLLKNIYWKDTAGNKMAWRFNLETITEKYDNIREAVPFFESNVPVLVVRGSRSNYINDNDLADFQKRFRNCTDVTIRDAAHWVHAEKPDEFFNTVLDFIKD